VAAAQKKQPPAHPLDLNVANVKELEQVPGSGPQTARSIVVVRDMSGPFRHVEDLPSIKGISRGKIDTIRPYSEVTSPPAHKSPP
jgi:competence protein ComEA